MTKENLLTNILKWGVLATIVAIATPAFAVGIGDTLNEFTTAEAGGITGIISVIAYIGAAVLGISGALKLKAHAENPASEKMAPGIARLLAGGALAALPFLLKMLVDTTHLSEEVQFTPLPVPTT